MSHFIRLKGKNLVNEKDIDYQSLIQNDLFKKDYLALTNSLKNIDLNKLLDGEQNDINILSFFISNYCRFIFILNYAKEK